MVKYPSLTQTFLGVHERLGLVGNSLELSNHKIDWNSGEQTIIEDLSKQLKEMAGTSSGLRLAKFMVHDLESIVKRGRIDIENAWYKHMAAIIQKDIRNVSFFEPEDAESFDSLLKKLQDWCFNSNHGQYQLNAEKWRKEKIKTLGSIIYPGKATVKLAITFHNFALIWNSSNFLDGIAYVLATLGSIEQKYHWQIFSKFKFNFGTQPYFSSIESVFEQAHQNPDISSSEDFERIFRETIKNPSDFDLEKGLQSLLNLMPIQDGERIVNDVFTMSQDYQLSEMQGMDTKFWDNLLGFHENGEFQTLVDIYKRVFDFVKHGKPFDKSWEYYELMKEVFIKWEQ
ncbi:hypothetical protein PGT21_024137 [Puccinia graminis f. sp. tritici]|nr:hypothetical protein PGT21_024137 [Puccinia graminis f. sp. tritici]